MERVLVTLQNRLVKLASAFVPTREGRRRFRRLHEANDAPRLLLPDGESIYYPIYNPGSPPPVAEPEIFNADGRRIRTCFIRDYRGGANLDYRGGPIFWDRYNYRLRHHLYTHRAMLETMGHPDKRYGALTETMGVVPEDYLIFDENPGLEKDFDRIFTYSRRLLDKLPNAAFVPFCSNVWLDFTGWGDSGLRTDGLHASKHKDVSILSSGKIMCPLHVLRLETAKKLRRLGLADAFGTFDPSLGYVRAYDTLADYRFSVVFENSVEDYCFTEKLTNCFACQTIPIYVGPPGIGRFFNTDGMICLRPEQVGDIEGVLKRATPEFYAERLPAVLDNYRRSARYHNVIDHMYEDYLAADFEGKDNR